jgi:DNA-directed RNA polymerase subunit RPC12/RpoP
MKSFRIYRREPFQTPERCAPDYSDEELNCLREEFREPAARYRRNLHLFILVLALLFAAFFVIVWKFPHANDAKGVSILFAIFAVVLGFDVVCPEPKCPGCQNNVLTKKVGDFCPECGSRSLTKPKWFGRPSCSACGKHLRLHKGRLYRIRACTHCGVWLDDQGL